MVIKKSRGHIFKRGNIFYLQYNIKGKRIIKSLNCTSTREAEKKRDEILNPILTLNTQSDLAYITAEAKKLYRPKKFLIEQAVRDFFCTPSMKKLKSKTLRDYQFKVNHFLDWLQQNYQAFKFISDVTAEIAKEYATNLYNTGISHKVYNESLNTLARFWESFKEQSDLLENPFEAKKIARLTKNPVSRKEFNRKEITKLLDSINKLNIPYPTEYEVLFYLGTFAGFRLKDSALLTWNDINFKNNLISVVPYKTRNHDIKIRIPIHPSLRVKLLEAKTWQKNKYVLPEIAKTYNENDRLISCIIKKIMIANDFINDIDIKTASQKKLTPCIYGYHSLRYSFVSFCAEAGVPLALVQSIVGHLNQNMTIHYSRFSQEYQQKAIENLKITSVVSEQSSLLESIIPKLKMASESTLKRIDEFLKNF